MIVERKIDFSVSRLPHFGWCSFALVLCRRWTVF